VVKSINMVLSSKTALVFTSHIGILALKIWFIYKLSVMFDIINAPKKPKQLLMYEKMDALLYLISVIVLIIEIYYIYCFFNPIIPHSYKYFEMMSGAFAMIYIIKTRKQNE